MGTRELAAQEVERAAQIGDFHVTYATQERNVDEAGCFDSGSCEQQQQRQRRDLKQPVGDDAKDSGGVFHAFLSVCSGDGQNRAAIGCYVDVVSIR
jgi:hypothetical protein